MECTLKKFSRGSTHNELAFAVMEAVVLKSGFEGITVSQGVMVAVFDYGSPHGENIWCGREGHLEYVFSSGDFFINK